MSKTFLLRIEATNLANFVLDSDDLSTIRGGGLLLLNSPKFLTGQIDQVGESNSIFKSGDGLLKWDSTTASYSLALDGGKQVTLRLVSCGASNSLFEFNAEDGSQADEVRRTIADWLRLGMGKRDQAKYLTQATFAVEVAPMTENFTSAADQVLSKVRLAQMRQPNVSFGPLQTSSNAGVPTNFCDIDHKRSRVLNLNHETFAYASATDKNFVSRASRNRRAYGRQTKVTVYQMVAQGGTTEFSWDVYKNFEPAWEFAEIARRDGNWRTDDDRNLSDKDPFASAKNKLCVLYADTNKLSKLIRAAVKGGISLQEIDEHLMNQRAALMQSLIRHIRQRPYWQVHPCDDQGKRIRREEKALKKHRLETLLWGGDELIWVVPAWCAAETVQFFFEKTKNWKLTPRSTETLTQSMGMVICSYKAPIRSIVTLAKELCDSVKKPMAVRSSEPRDALAYQVLESFDHLGRDFAEARRQRCFPQMKDDDLILSADAFQELVKQLKTIKQHVPRGRMHQIAHAFLRSKIGGKLADDPLERMAKVSDSPRDVRQLVKSCSPWPETGLPAAKWFHLIELWDYAAFDVNNVPTSDIQAAPSSQQQPAVRHG